MADLIRVNVMTRISNEAQPHGLIWRSRNVARAGILAGLRAIENRMALHREEAMLRSLDSRLLEDIGFEPPAKSEAKSDSVCRSDFAPLWEPFSWIRFGK